MSEPDECLECLDEWLKKNKDRIYDETIKDHENSQVSLVNYKDSLKLLYKKLIDAIESEDTTILKDIEWPDQLMECIKDMNIRTVITYRIEHWLYRFPFVKSKLHLNELEKENVGVN